MVSPAWVNVVLVSTPNAGVAALLNPRFSPVCLPTVGVLDQSSVAPLETTGDPGGPARDARDCLLDHGAVGERIECGAPRDERDEGERHGGMVVREPSGGEQMTVMASEPRRWERDALEARDAGWTYGFRKANSVTVPSNAMTEFMSMPASL